MYNIYNSLLVNAWNEQPSPNVACCKKKKIGVEIERNDRIIYSTLLMALCLSLLTISSMISPSPFTSLSDKKKLGEEGLEKIDISPTTNCHNFFSDLFLPVSGS